MKLLLLVAGLALLLTGALAAVAHTAPAATPPELGIAPVGTNAMELVGHTDQVGGTFTSYGYLTHIAGLPDTELFSNANPITHTEANARFTFFSQATLSARSIITTPIIMNTTDGTGTFYYNASVGATFDNPASFRLGTAITTASFHYNAMTNVFAPNTAIVNAWIDVTQLTAEPFTIGGQIYHLGKPGLLERITTAGEGYRREPTIPLATVIYGGNAVVVGQQTMLPVIMRNFPGLIRLPF